MELTQQYKAVLSELNDALDNPSADASKKNLAPSGQELSNEMLKQQVVERMAGTVGNAPDYDTFAKKLNENGDGKISDDEMWAFHSKLVDIIKQEPSFKATFDNEQTPNGLQVVGKADAKVYAETIAQRYEQALGLREANGEFRSSVPMNEFTAALNSEKHQPGESLAPQVPGNLQFKVNKLVEREMGGGDTVVKGDTSLVSTLDADNNGSIDASARQALINAYKKAGLNDDQITEKLKLADHEQYSKGIDNVAETMIKKGGGSEQVRARIASIIDQDGDKVIDEKAKKPLLDSLQKQGLLPDAAKQKMEEIGRLLKDEKFSPSISLPSDGINTTHVVAPKLTPTQVRENGGASVV